jgi:hypothetical protein
MPIKATHKVLADARPFMSQHGKHYAIPRATVARSLMVAYDAIFLRT